MTRMSDLDKGVPMRPYKKAAILLAIPLVLVIFAAALYLRGGREVTLHWDYDYGKTPPCTPQSKVMCVTGFNVFIGDPNHRRQQVFVPNRFDEKKAVAGRDLTVSLHVSTFGRVQFCVVSVAESAAPGRPQVESLPLCSTALVPPRGFPSNPKIP
jgi:hypothetical protein